MRHLIAALPLRSDSRLLSLLAGVAAAVAALLVGPTGIDGAAAGVAGGYRQGTV